MGAGGGEQGRTGARPARPGLRVAVAGAIVVVAVAGVATLVRHSGTGSRPGSSASPASASASSSGVRPGPEAGGLSGPHPGKVTQASLGDPLFPGLGNGGYDVQRYDLRLRYPRKDPRQTITGSVTVTARATAELPALDLDAATGSGIAGVLVDGSPARYAVRGQELVITPGRPLHRGRLFTVAVQHFTATPTSPSIRDLGVAPFLATRDGTALAGQPNAMHRFFPCNDHPSDKATFDITVDAPAGWTAVANGNLVGEPATSRGRTSWRYREDRPMATELLQIAVGAYTVARRGSVGAVAVRDVVPTRLAGQLLPALAVQADQLRWMAGKVGPYPFDTYGSLVVDARLGFSLETQTLSLHDSALVTAPSVPGREGVLAHELAHQWFGDDVSPARWSDVWLNEGHATWYQELWSAQRGTLPSTDDVPDFESLMRQFYEGSDTARGRYGPPGRPESGDVGALFNPDVYAGGALVLYALQQEIGTRAFGDVERRWVAVHAGGSATSADFAALASRVAGRDLTAFFDAWLYSRATPPMPGHPDWTATPAPS